MKTLKIYEFLHCNLSGNVNELQACNVAPLSKKWSRTMLLHSHKNGNVTGLETVEDGKSDQSATLHFVSAYNPVTLPAFNVQLLHFALEAIRTAKFYLEGLRVIAGNCNDRRPA